EPIELWRLHLEDVSGRPRRLSVIAYLEWNCGVAPAPRREFQKLFLETGHDAAAGVITAGSHMWDVPSRRWGHWNRSFPYWSAFAASAPVAAAEGDKGAFLGRCGDWTRPAALQRDARWPSLFGRHYDPVAALRCDVEIATAGACDLAFTLATASERDEAISLAREFAVPGMVDASLDDTAEDWHFRLLAHRIETPEPLLDALANDWLRYQAISARLWGRAGYYQQSGAYGFRDQLQDSQVWL